MYRHEEGIGKKKGKKSKGYEERKNIGERNRRRKNGREGNKGKEPDGNGRGEKIR